MALRPSHLLSVLAAATVGFAGWWILRDPGPDPGSGGRSAAARRAAPVEIAPVQVGDLVERRVFGGTLIPRAQFLVAPKAAGRVEALYVDGEPKPIAVRYQCRKCGQVLEESTDPAVLTARHD